MVSAVAGWVAAGGWGVTASAADTWTNTLGDGNWNSTGNWADNSVPLSTDAVTFALPGPVSHTVTLPASPFMFAQSLTFNDSYTLNNGRLDMAGAPISVASGKTATINSQIGSTTGLTKTGDGTLVLGGNNTSTLANTGDMTISAGTVRITADNNLGSVFRTKLTGTLEVDGTFTTTRRFETLDGAISVTAGNTLTCTANDQFGFSSGAIYKIGPGTLKVMGQSSRFGTNYVLGGTLRYESGSGFPQLGYGPIIMTDATFELVNVGGGFPNVTVGANSIVRGIGNSGLSAIKCAVGGDVFPTLSTGTSVSDKLDVTVGSTFGGTIGSTVNISGAGTVKLLGGSNNYPGGWNIFSGGLRVSNQTQLGTGTSTIPIGSGGTFILDNTVVGRSFNLASGSAIRGAGTLAQTSGFLNVASGASITLGNLAAADIYAVGGSNRLNGGAGGTITVDGPGTVSLIAPTAYLGAWNLTGGALRLYMESGLGSGASAMSVGGSGMLEIYNTPQSFSRDINISGGTLRGTQTGTFNGTINVASGASVTLARSLVIGDSPNDLTGGGAGTVLHVTDFGNGTTLTQPSNIVANWSLESGGRLTISDDAQLGAASNTVNANHVASYFVTAAPITSLRNLTFHSGHFDTGPYDSSFGQVSGTSGTFYKNGAGTLSIDLIRTTGLNVMDGTVKLKPGGSPASASRLSTLSVSSPGKLDVTDNTLVVRSTPIGSWDGGAYTDLTGLLAAGRNGGAWDGSGIVTSQTSAMSGYTSLGIATAQESSRTGTSVAGSTLSATDVLVMYTYGGDANLSGNVDVDDYGQIDFNSSTGGMLTGWFNGDFDYSGLVDVDDYGIIDFVVNIQGAPFSTGAGGMELASVPEPAGLGVLFAGAMGLRRRRR